MATTPSGRVSRIASASNASGRPAVEARKRVWTRSKERSGKPGAIGVASHEHDIGVGSAPGVLQKRLIGVEPDHAAGRTDALAQQRRDAAGAATEIEAAPPSVNPDAIEHDGAVGRHGGRLDMKALDLASAPLDRIGHGCPAKMSGFSGFPGRWRLYGPARAS